MVCVLSLVLTLLGSAMIATPGVLRGIVLDTNGAAIGMAHVIVHEDASGKHLAAPGKTANDIVVQTDAVGRFRVEVDSGFFDVCIMATGFTPLCYKVYVNDGETKDRRIRLRLDPAVVRKLGDSF